MALDRVVVTGGTGFVGSRLVHKLVTTGTRVTILTRAPPSPRSRVANDLVDYAGWGAGTGGDPATLTSVLSGADAVINLCGASIATRWTPATKRAIRSSRIDATNSLVSACEALGPDARPRALVSVSGVGYYGDAVPHARVLSEADGPGDDFLARVCVDWERAAAEAERRAGLRVAILRLGIVLGREGGALAKMLPAFRAFVGGPLGSGRQWFPWVHVEDVVNALVVAAGDDAYEGVFNCVAPNVVSMNGMADALGRALNRPALVPVPGFALQLLLGEASSFLLAGHHAIPERLSENGFQFEFRDIDAAMRDIVLKS